MSLMLNARVLICLARVSTSEWKRVIAKSLVVLGISWDKDSGEQNEMLPNVSLTWIESRTNHHVVMFFHDVMCMAML